METNNNEETTALNAQKAKHMALSSLPSFDDDSPATSNADEGATVVITAQAAQEKANATTNAAEPQSTESPDDAGATQVTATPEEAVDTQDAGVTDAASIYAIATAELEADKPGDATVPMSAEQLDTIATETVPDPSAATSYASPDDPYEFAPIPTMDPAGSPAAGPSFMPAANSVEEPRRKGAGRKVLIALGIVAGVLLLIYVGTSIFFMSHFLPNTTVNGEDVSLMSVGDLAKHVTDVGARYSAHVTGDGIDMTISASDIDYNYDGVAYGEEAKAQIPAWAWPAEIAKQHAYTVDKAISFNDGKLAGIVDAAVAKANEGSTPPTNATMHFNETTNLFEPVAQAFGTAVERDTVLATVSEGISTLQEQITLAEPELVQPAVTLDDPRLAAGIERANTLLKTPIVLRIANTDAHTIDPKLLASWLTMNAECAVETNTEAIKEWAQGPLSEQLDTIGSKHTFTRPDGKEIEVEGGTYGWSINGEELSNILSNNVRDANTAPIDVPLLQEAAHWAPGGQEWPNRYIDVDLSEQYVRMYDDNSALIWESPCVSGNPIYGGGTDAGVYYIFTKASPMVLVGLDYNGDGEPDYKTPVTYWMPFDGGEGLHDATWRGAFGGSIYTYDGSHGCVNLPYYDAEQLYGMTEVGDVVIVHW